MKPRKVRYYLERPDEAFEMKMADVLCVYREVAVLQANPDAETNVAILSYDEKPGIGRLAISHPTCHGSHDRIRASRATTSTGVTERSACSPGSTC